MEHLHKEDAQADENVVTYDLNEIFNDPNNSFKQIDQGEIPDSVLSEISANIDAIKQEIVTEPKATCGNPQQKSNQFALLSNDIVDKIAEESVKKRTLKQTTWGVKVFRGKKIDFSSLLINFYNNL